MYQADALAIASGTTEHTLIENAGCVVAEEIIRRYGAKKPSFSAVPATMARMEKWPPATSSWGWPVKMTDDITAAELIIDALYGAGLNRDFPSDLASKINSAGVPIISIDLPSGLDGLTGQPRGASVKADLTITFFRKKPAHLLLPGRALCGEIVVADMAFLIRCSRKSGRNSGKTPNPFFRSSAQAPIITAAATRSLFQAENCIRALPDLPQTQR